MIMEKLSEMKAAIHGQVRLEEVLKSRRVVSYHSLSSVPSFLKRLKEAPILFPDDFCSVFTFELMQNRHLGISNL